MDIKLYNISNVKLSSLDDLPEPERAVGFGYSSEVTPCYLHFTCQSQVTICKIHVKENFFVRNNSPNSSLFLSLCFYLLKVQKMKINLA